MTMIKAHVAALLAAMTFFSPAVALSDSGTIARIADGKTWNAQPSGGPKMKLTFNPDGTGKMSFGIMTRKLKWTPDGDGICMTGMPGGKRCIAFAPTSNGYVGTSDDGRSLTLTRG
jgi:hypothetical protein